MRSTLHQPGQQLRSTALRYGLPRAWNGVRQPASARGLEGQTGAVGQVENVRSLTVPRDEELSRLEAVLLLAREPLSSRKLSQYANLADGTRARTLIRRLNEGYDGAGRAFRVEHLAGGYQLLTRRKFAAWLRRLAHIPGETRLSAPALETLAVIAYRQPVPRADIEAIRGVNCGEILRQLMERDLIRIGGRSEELGRPYLYSTTKRFLQIFGLANLDGLPRGDVLRDAPLPTHPPLLRLPRTEPLCDEPLPCEAFSDEPFSDEPLSDEPLSDELLSDFIDE
jgi:segregation and condensation protein B